MSKRSEMLAMARRLRELGEPGLARAVRDAGREAGRIRPFALNGKLYRTLSAAARAEGVSRRQARKLGRRVRTAAEAEGIEAGDVTC